MNELLEKEQILSVVPRDLQYSNKGKVVEIKSQYFILELVSKPDGIIPKQIIEFYSHTKNGTLFFSTSVLKIEENKIVILMPRTHRFLQRRAFTRIQLEKDLVFKTDDKIFEVKTKDLSAGGMKIESSVALDINESYSSNLELMSNVLDVAFEPIRIEKSGENSFTVSGRFKNLSNLDKMTLSQFCMRRNLEILNR